MRLRKIGSFTYKGSVGYYVEAVDIPRDVPRYAAIEFACLEDHEGHALARGETIESTVLDADPEGWLHATLDHCFK